MSQITISVLLLGVALVLVLAVLIVKCVRASFDRAHRTVAAARAMVAARRDDHGAGEQHPQLIDLNSGHEYEWVDDPDNPENSGYANVADHDFAWSRDVLERVAPLVELRSLDPSQIEQLRAQLDQ
jgi:type II secretory pathway pseudopilin PulG